MVRKVRDDYTGIRVIKALSKIDYESDSFKTINDTVVKNEIKATLTMGISNPLLNAILNLGMCAVIFIGAYRVSEGYVKSWRYHCFYLLFYYHFKCGYFD